MLKRILVMPLDDRPCHNDFLIEACKNISDIELSIVPKEYLGHFDKSGSHDKIRDYLLDKACDIDTLIVSTDGMIYEGLMQARSMESCDLETALKRISVLNDIRKINPNIKILAYSGIMRLTTSVTSSTDIKEWENIFKYSQLIQKVEIDPSCKDELEDVISNISEENLNDYLSARKRNHEINKECLKLVKDNVIDYLVLVQEDASPYGLHRKEQEILRNIVKEYEIEEKCVIKNGADEMAALLLAKEINKEKFSVTLETKYLDKSFIAKYEDETTYKNLLLSMQVAGITFDENDNDIALIVTPTKGECLDLCFENLDEKPDINNEQLLYYKKYNGKKIAVLDVQNSNGGDVRILESLCEELSNSELIGYSAWNTACNSIGTLLLDIVIAKYYKQNKDYIEMRIVDDAIYQGCVRKKYNEYLKENQIDVWKDAGNKEHIKVLQAYLNEEISNHKMITNDYSISLPWGRTFEAKVEKN